MCDETSCAPALSTRGPRAAVAQPGHRDAEAPPLALCPAHQLDQSLPQRRQSQISGTARRAPSRQKLRDRGQRRLSALPQLVCDLVVRLPGGKRIAIDAKAPLKAMLVDSWYDVYLGVVVLVRVVDGSLKKGQRVRMMGTGAAYDIERVGFFTPKMVNVDELGPGEVGFITAAINEVDIEQAFGLDPLEEGPLAVCGFGIRAAQKKEVEFDPLGAVWGEATV